MHWFLYDNGRRHERVKLTIGLSLEHGVTDFGLRKQKII